MEKATGKHPLSLQKIENLHNKRVYVESWLPMSWKAMALKENWLDMRTFETFIQAKLIGRQVLKKQKKNKFVECHSREVELFFFFWSQIIQWLFSLNN